MTNLKNLLREVFKIFDDLLSGERSLPFGLLVFCLFGGVGGGVVVVMSDLVHDVEAIHGLC